jgi:SAM-dependent methyltransferase
MISVDGRDAGWVAHPDLVEHYASARNRAEDLYPSEARFLPWLAGRADSILDVGCASGGFADIWRSYAPELRYQGADRSASLVAAAARLHPADQFIEADCVTGLPFEAESATVVQALGWLHWEPDYERALRELWRVTGRYLLCDFRIHDESDDDVEGIQRLALAGTWDGATTVPYVCASWRRLASLFLELAPSRILGYGYHGQPRDADVAVNRVCFAAFVLERGGSSEPPTVCVDAPLPWPGRLLDAVDLESADCLDRHVPKEDGQ